MEESGDQATLYQGCRMVRHGWEANNADEVERVIIDFTRNLSRAFDLRRLESIVVAYDYREGVASIDKGDIGGSSAPTSNEYGQGIAMALPCERDGELWHTVVLWLPLVMAFVDESNEFYPVSKYTLVHELAHVHEAALYSERAPGGWRSSIGNGPVESALLGLTRGCVSEFVASYLSAFVFPEHGLSYLDMLAQALQAIDSQVWEARKRFIEDNDINSLWDTVRGRLQFLFMSLGYGLGHASWVLGHVEATAELRVEVERRLVKLKELPSGWLVDAVFRSSEAFYHNQTWDGIEDYRPMMEVGRELLERFGLYPQISGENLYIGVPHHHPFQLRGGN